MLATCRPKQTAPRPERGEFSIITPAITPRNTSFRIRFNSKSRPMLHFRCVMLNLDGGAIAASATTASRQTEKPIQPIGSADQEESRSTLPGVDCCNTTDAAVGSNFASNTCAGCVFDALGGDTSDKGRGWQCSHCIRRGGAFRPICIAEFAWQCPQHPWSFTCTAIRTEHASRLAMRFARTQKVEKVL